MRVKKNVVFVLVATLVLVVAIVGIQQWRAASALHEQVERHIAAAIAMENDPERLSDAKVELDRALKLAPDDTAALQLRAKLLHALMKQDEAEADLKAVMPRLIGDERARAQLLLANVLVARYRGTGSDDLFRRARNAYLEAQQVAATKVEALFGFAMLFLEKGSNRDFEKATELLQQLIDRHPEAPEAKRAAELLELIKPKEPKSG